MRAAPQFFVDNLKCAEIGVGAGSNAIDMMTNIPFGKFYLVDSYNVNNSTFQFGSVMSLEARGEFIRGLKEKLLPFGSRANLIVMESEQAARRFPDEYFDFIYIDAQHEHADVLKDLRSWYPKLKTGGVISGHDFGITGVKKAIEEYFMDGCVNSRGEDWYCIK